MKLKYSLRVAGQDYTDKLISVSSIDAGVRELGYGYISDISVECAYDSNLMDAVEQTAEVGILLDTTSIVYQGTIKKVSLQGGKLSIIIAPRKLEELFKPRAKIYISTYRKYVTVPVVYGNGTCKAKLLATRRISNGVYRLLVGDNANVAGAYQSDNAYFVDEKIQLRSEEAQWKKLPDGYTNAWDISAYKSDECLLIIKSGYTKYGVYQDSNGNLVEEFIGSSDEEVFIRGGIYQWVKFVEDTTGGSSGGSGAPPLRPPPLIYIYENRLPSSDTEISTVQSITVSSVSSPKDIIVDILSRNGIPNFVPRGGFLGINLTFQADESFREIVQKVAEQGLIYLVPYHNTFRIIPAVFASFSSSYTFTDSVILPQSLSVEKSTPAFSKLTVLYNRGENSLQRGSGFPEKEYRADYIIDNTSAGTFADAYLAYHQKTVRVKFSTPFLPELLGVEVGDPVSLNYPLYSINGNFQVVQKTIRKERVDWVVREV